MSNEAEFDRTLSEQESELHKKNKAARRRNLLIVILAILAVLFALVCGWLAFDNQRLADANAQYGAKQAQEKQTIAKEAQKALCGTKDSEIYDKAICEKLADAAQEPPPVPPAPADGPSQEDLVKAFRAYCADGNCKGRDGAAPTADDIAAAFMKFCADGRCRGAEGKDATPAKDGPNGAAGANGKDGVSLPPPPEMVLAAITQYCADGKDGAPGPAPSQFTFTWAGTTYTCTPNPPGSTTYACDPTSPGPPVIGVNP
jgi:hypothetical protein